MFKNIILSCFLSLIFFGNISAQEVTSPSEDSKLQAPITQEKISSEKPIIPNTEKNTENNTENKSTKNLKGQTPVLDFFHGAECPHCQKEKRWHPVLRAMFPGIKINQYEIWHHPENQELLQKRLDELGKESTGVPTNIIGEDVVTGFSAETIVKAITKTYGIEPLKVDEDAIYKLQENKGKQKKLMIFALLALVIVGGGFIVLRQS